MKVVSIIVQSLIITYRVIMLGFFSLCILAALETSFGVFPDTFMGVLHVVPEIGVGELLSKYGHCILWENLLIEDYCNVLVLAMPLFYLQMVFFGFGYAFQFQWEIREYRDGSLLDTYDGSLLVGLILLVVRIFIGFFLFMISPLVLLIVIGLNIKKLVQTILD